MRSRFALAPLFLLLCCAVAQAASPAVRVEGTQVTVEPPEGFVKSSRFPGFEDAERGASLMVTELPAPFEKVRPGMNAEGLKRQGMRLQAREEATFGDKKGELMAVLQSANDIEFKKWLAVIPIAPNTTALVVGTYPNALHTELGLAMRASGPLCARREG